ncbi:MAG: hypothetical protein AB9819_04630 [Methanomassiliicoccales archaeon]
MPIEGRFELVLENARARLGMEELSEGAAIEVMVLLLPASPSISHQDLRRSAKVVELLEGLGVTLQHIEGGWGVGELAVSADALEGTLAAIGSVLRSLGHER